MKAKSEGTVAKDTSLKVTQSTKKKQNFIENKDNYAISIILSGIEYGSISSQMMRKYVAVKMWFCRWILKIVWAERVSKEKVSTKIKNDNHNQKEFCIRRNL